jgi:hypothetical protein
MTRRQKEIFRDLRNNRVKLTVDGRLFDLRAQTWTKITLSTLAGLKPSLVEKGVWLLHPERAAQCARRAKATEAVKGFLDKHPFVSVSVRNVVMALELAGLLKD